LTFHDLLLSGGRTFTCVVKYTYLYHRWHKHRGLFICRRRWRRRWWINNLSL